MIRVLIVDDQPLVRAGLRTMLDYEDDLEVLGEAGDGATALDEIHSCRPDVVVLDIRMPGIDGLAVLRTVTGDPDLVDVRIIVLTTFDLDEYVAEALAAGASAFLRKDAAPDEVIRAVRVVANGEALLSPAVTRRVIRSFVDRRPADGELSRDVAALTVREREVVALVGRGLSNHEIAMYLVISPATARTHVSRAMTKLNARDRAQLVVIAYHSGLVAMDGL